MATVRFIQGKIRRLEGFEARFRHGVTGRDVNDNMELPRGYPYQNAAADNMSVADWKRNRFDTNYPGFECDVRDARGNSIPGMTLLSTVRRTFDK
jgi:hypothetical protein